MILITGGTGLAGSHLVLQLLRKGEKLKILIRSESSKSIFENLIKILAEENENHLKTVEYSFGDILDKASLEEAFVGVTHVYHCAAMVSFNRSDRKKMLDTNIRGTANVVNCCLEHGVKKLVHVSSVAAVKSSAENKKIVEDNGWPTGKNLDYAYSKTESEFEVWRGISEGLNAVIVNPSVILGFGDPKKSSTKLFGRVKQGMKFFTRGITGFVDAEDVARAMVMLMESDVQAERYIVNAENLSYEELFAKMAGALKVKPPKHYAGRFLTEIAWRAEFFLSLILFKKPILTKGTARTSHVKQYYSSDKLTNAFNFKFTSIDNTIKRVASLMELA
ncbi:MAG: NAD-dependent epimerase/dehydratase family protein [Bacteroidales bacterium]|nr:NAD-dependent epimerase/dehydratase family protein [Bacteroidales bacterium]MBN2818771.1 NAD-dependent epimerase/dehydratase family protein [Bacteroidales bacterium]